MSLKNEIEKEMFVESIEDRFQDIASLIDSPIEDVQKRMKTLSFSDYNCLQINSLVTLSDSGTISEESSILKFRALNIRDSHERPEAMEETTVIMTGTNFERIIQSIELVKSQNMSEILIDVDDYKSTNISSKVERLLLSYTDYVNKTVWKKEF